MLTFTIIMISVVLPLYILYWLANGRTVNKSQLIIKSFAAVLLIYTLFYFNNWATTSIYLRYFYLLLCVLTLGYAWWQAWKQPWQSPLPLRQWAPVLGGIILLSLCSLVLANIAGGDDVPGEVVEIEFPLQRGTFFMVQAGNSQGLNGHMAVRDQPEYRGQTWAIDIVQLSVLGSRARGIYPDSPEAYYIFGTPVYSPCNGGVVATENELPDLNPPERDRDNLAGNFVKIECEDGFYVLLAHFRQGSLTVAQGDIVSTGSRLGAVGNSGNTTEPHLHIHAQETEGETSLLDADPLPIIFRGYDWLVRNDVIRTGR